MSDQQYFEKDPQAEAMRVRLIQAGATIFRNWGATPDGPFCVMLPSGAFVVERYEDHATRADARLSGMFRACAGLAVHQ